MTAEVHVDQGGPEAGPLVVLVHGTMDRADGMAKVSRRLEDRCCVVRYDRRGYAGSNGLPGPYGCEQHVDDLLSVLDGRVGVVVGHSYGGNVALAAAARAPTQVRAVGIYEVPMSWFPWWPTTTAGSAAVEAARDGGPEAAAEHFFRRLVGDGTWERLPESTRRARRAEGRALVAEMHDLMAGPPWRAEDVAVPVVAGHGTRSQPHHQAGVRWVVEHVAEAELMMLEGASHGAHLTHPRAFADLVERVVARSGLRPPEPASP